MTAQWSSVPWGPAERGGLEPIDGGATAASGFRASGVISGLKPSGRPDLAMLAADAPGAATAVTTTSLTKAPSCSLTERHVADGRAQAVIINSGNANVCTPDGDAHAERLARAAASALGIEPTDVLVMSTGVIGVPLPIERIEAAAHELASSLLTDGGALAAEAMLTTDSRSKQVAYRVSDEHGTCVVGGMAKGVGMIEPKMATMLAVLTTDAPVEPHLLRQLLRTAVATTFNRISVDGDTSTSDTVTLMASGTATSPPGVAALQRGVTAVCADLARHIVGDGEGATRTAAITVRDAPTEANAEALARAIATSLLVRAAIHGADPNWGRILMAMGTAGVAFDPRRVTVRCGGVTVCRFGVATSFDRGQASAAMDHELVHIEVLVGSGDASATVLTCDLTPEYVEFNAEYTT